MPEIRALKAVPWELPTQQGPHKVRTQAINDQQHPNPGPCSEEPAAGHSSSTDVLGADNPGSPYPCPPLLPEVCDQTEVLFSALGFCALPIPCSSVTAWCMGIIFCRHCFRQISYVSLLRETLGNTFSLMWLSVGKGLFQKQKIP